MSKVKNPLLLPNEVGKGRPPVADLPPESFSYGKRTTSDGLSTGQALGEWAVFKPNMKDLPGRDYMALNRMAIKHGSGLTAVQVAEFRKKHDCRLQRGAQSQLGGSVIPVHEMPPCGIRSFIDGRPSTPINQVMEFKYATPTYHKPEKVYRKLAAASTHAPAPRQKRIPVVYTKVKWQRRRSRTTESLSSSQNSKTFRVNGRR